VHSLAPSKLLDPCDPRPIDNGTEAKLTQIRIAELPCNHGTRGVIVGDAERAVVPEQHVPKASAVRVPAPP
jgi:hypothetical protein